jgi:histidyl-tRNA synthetase
MAAQKPTLPKGTRDFGPADVQKRKYILNTIEKVFKKYGFMPLETPTMENLSTLEGKYGEEGDKLLFRILDSGDYLKSLKEHNDKILSDESQDATFAPSFSGKLIDLDSKATTKFISEKGLRYDLTVPFARYVVQHQNEIEFPFKRYQIQPVWRADRPQRGRYREFYQCDADIIGSDSLVNEAELIALFQSIFNSLKLRVNLYLNSRKILAGIVDRLGESDRFVAFAVALDKLDKIGWDNVAKELVENGFTQAKTDAIKDLVLFEGSNEDKIVKLTSFFDTNATGLQGLAEIREVLSLSETNGFPSDNLVFDYRLARGLSYYTGLIYEGKAVDLPFGSIVGGGRYDDLTSSFGLPNMSGVGISFGIERILDVMEELKLFPEIATSASAILFTYFDYCVI